MRILRVLMSVERREEMGGCESTFVAVFGGVGGGSYYSEVRGCEEGFCGVCGHFCGEFCCEHRRGGLVI